VVAPLLGARGGVVPTQEGERTRDDGVGRKSRAGGNYHACVGGLCRAIEEGVGRRRGWNVGSVSVSSANP